LGKTYRLENIIFPKIFDSMNDQPLNSPIFRSGITEMEYKSALAKSIFKNRISNLAKANLSFYIINPRPDGRGNWVKPADWKI
jgi:hypothetical protein